MKRNRFEPVEDRSNKYILNNNRRLSSKRLLKQNTSKGDPEEPIIRKRTLGSLKYFIWHDFPERGYYRSWKYRSRFNKQYLRHRRR